MREEVWLVILCVRTEVLQPWKHVSIFICWKADNYRQLIIRITASTVHGAWTHWVGSSSKLLWWKIFLSPKWDFHTSSSLLQPEMLPKLMIWGGKIVEEMVSKALAPREEVANSEKERQTLWVLLPACSAVIVPWMKTDKGICLSSFHSYSVSTQTKKRAHHLHLWCNGCRMPLCISIHPR